MLVLDRNPVDKMTNVTFGRAAALPSACLLFLWVTLIPSIFCFHSITNSHRQRRYQHVMIPRSQSPAISTSQRSNRGFQIEAFWRSSSTSNDDDGSDEDEAGTEEEKKQEEDASISSSSNEPPFALTEPSPEYVVQPTMKKSLNKNRDKSLLTLFNHIGNNFKPMAKKAVANGYQSKDQLKKVLYASKACLYYTLFIVYRSYRGFIVLLPATFR